MTTGKRVSIFAVLIAVGLAAMVLAACGGGSNGGNGSRSNAGMEASDSSGGVEVTLTRIVSPSDLPKDTEALDLSRFVVFAVSMTAHSGDLSKYDMKQNAVLRAADKEYPVADWRFTSKDAHHPQGLLSFDVTPEQAGTSFQVVIRNLGGAAERVLGFGG